MKKFLLSSVVVVGFAGYSASQKLDTKHLLTSAQFKYAVAVPSQLLEVASHFSFNPTGPVIPTPISVNPEVPVVTVTPLPITITPGTFQTTPTPIGTASKGKAINYPTSTPKPGQTSTSTNTSVTNSPNPTTAQAATPTPTTASQQTSPTSTPSPIPTASPTPTTTPNSLYKDGSYTGSVNDAFYGNVQVQVVISGGKITAVNFLQYPNSSSHSRQINATADPILSQEAINAQSASVDTVSGATDTSNAFKQSLQYALNLAKA